MIKIEKLSKSYNLGRSKFEALKEIDLTIDKGEFVAIQGKSGAGKSTLLHILGCLDTYDCGSYSFNGVEIGKLGDGKTAKLRNREIGFVLQDFSLINHKKVNFNVMLPLFFNKTLSFQMKKGRCKR